jgi:3-hydroxyisobutyrate dehydrogenase
MARVLEAIGHGAAGSWSLNNLGPRWLARNFHPGFRLRHLYKDIQFCQEAIQALPPGPSAEYPGLTQALGLIRRSVEAGNGDLNINAIEKIFL